MGGPQRPPIILYCEFAIILTKNFFFNHASIIPVFMRIMEVYQGF